MSDDTIDPNENEDLSTSRRALLKGAVAAGVGAAVYASPIVSPVPAYATHGLSSWTAQSDVLCFWFSPNHQGKYGDWHLPKLIANVFNPVVDDVDYSDHKNTGSDVTTRMLIKVPPGPGAGVWRELQVGGHPNNWGGPSATDDFNVNGWNGGGMWVRLLDPNCEFVLIGLTSGKEAASGDDGCEDTVILTGIGSSNNVPITSTPPNNVPNPWQGDPVYKRYYHTGRPRKPPVPGIQFRIRCA